MSNKQLFAHNRSRQCHPRFEQLENRLCLSSISGYVWHDFNSNGTRESFVAGDEPDVVMVIDESGSTKTNYFGRVDERMDISGSRVVWDSLAYPPGSSGWPEQGIPLWDGNGLILIPFRRNILGEDDLFPCVSDSLVAWQGHDGNDYEIFLYDGTNIMQVTDNDYDDQYPRMSESTLAWQHWDGNDWEIQTTTVPEPSYVVFFAHGTVVLWNMASAMVFLA